MRDRLETLEWLDEMGIILAEPQIVAPCHVSAVMDLQAVGIFGDPPGKEDDTESLCPEKSDEKTSSGDAIPVPAQNQEQPSSSLPCGTEFFGQFGNNPLNESTRQGNL